MASAAFTARLLAATASVTTRRLRSGPARPSWTWGFEVVATALRAHARSIARRDWRGQRTAWQALSAPARILDEVMREPTTVGELGAEWFSPRAGITHPSVILYLHGGSFIYGSIETHREVIARLALATGGRVLALDYRLAPEHPYPAQLEDARRAHAHLRSSGVPSSCIVLAGDSAGGNLAALTTIALRDEGERPAAQLLLSPWVDLSACGGSLVENARLDYAEPGDFLAWAACYLDGSGVEPMDPRVSPLFADLRGLPPTCIVLGGAEVLSDQVHQFAARVRAERSELELLEEPDMIHNFVAFTSMFPRCGAPFAALGRFVHRHVVAAEG
jgi:epsilon-lactone hydrolase